MNGPQSGAGQHSNHTFDNGRKMNRNPVATRDPVVAQDIGHLANTRMQITVSQANNMIGFFRLPDQASLFSSALKMTVQTIHTGIQRSVCKPAVSGILRGGGRSDPVQSCALVLPVNFRVLLCCVCKSTVIGRGKAECARAERGGHKRSVLTDQKLKTGAKLYRKLRHKAKSKKTKAAYNIVILLSAFRRMVSLRTHSF